MSTTFEVTGTIVNIGTTQQVSDTFRKRAFVVSIGDGNYPQEVQFEAVKDNCPKLDAFKVGDSIRVLFNLRGRQWNKGDGSPVKWYNTLEAWKFELHGGTATTGEKDLTTVFDDIPF